MALFASKEEIAARSQASEITRLRAEVARLEHDNAHHRNASDIYHAEVARLEAELEEARKDAARWRNAVEGLQRAGWSMAKEGGHV